CGLRPDEGPETGGPHAPYRQSERSALYREHAERLVAAGHAYYTFDTPEEWEQMKARMEAAGVVKPQYNAAVRQRMRTSLALGAEETQRLLDAGTPHVIRLKVPPKEEVRFEDAVRGWVLVHSSTLDDKVLLKSDGLPTYHLANVIDDYLMGITHVVRGEEWLPSAPAHVLLYRFLGWEEHRPQFAHLPLLMKPNGNGKLSKRDADAFGFPIYPLSWTDPATGETSQGFREAGYLPEALLNFLALLGWNPGTEQELFTLDELVEAFSPERINKAGTRFDIEKAQWFNQQYLRRRPADELAGWLRDELTAHALTATEAQLAAAVELLRERVTFPDDLRREGRALFQSPTTYDENMAAKQWNAAAASVLVAYADTLAARGEMDADQARAMLQAAAEAKGLKVGKVMPALRLAVTGGAQGPDLMQTLGVLGGEVVAARIRAAVRTLAAAPAP
ncbi:MAG: glutamate--tRNA ligase, partial [Catalinimonas sp.]